MRRVNNSENPYIPSSYIRRKIYLNRDKSLFWKTAERIKDILWILFLSEKSLGNRSKKKMISLSNILFLKIYGPSLCRKLTPYSVQGFEKLTRLGNKYDGGYVFPQRLLSYIDREYCYGVGRDISFEQDLFKKKGVKIYLYDPTVESLPKYNKQFIFKREGLGPTKRKLVNTFRNHLVENNETAKNILLKIDIEGAEWPSLKSILRSSYCQKIAGIILEIHDLNKGYKYGSYLHILDLLEKKFTLVHAHGNNYGGEFKLNEFNFPKVMELTFLNNKFVAKKNKIKNTLPSKLDFPNRKSKPDIFLDYWKKEADN